MSSKPSPLPRPAAGAPANYELPADAPKQEEQPTRDLENSRIVLCVTGSVAAYKAVLILRLLQERGASVEVVLSASAERFVAKQTFSGLTGHPVHTTLFDDLGGERHVALADGADAILVAPATADVMARMAHGRASDLTTALVLCAECPVIVAPAMHPRMWENQATARTVEALRALPNVSLLEPVHGEVASGAIGTGRMQEPEDIVAELARMLAPSPLALRHIVVTAGPTAEALDPVRHLSNRSSGKMGFSLAERAALRGAKVTLISGPCALTAPRGVTHQRVRTALEMQAALREATGPDLSGADAVIMAAAVADYRVADPSPEKLKREGTALTLELVSNPDIIAELGEARTSRAPVLIGFALETKQGQELIALARTKLAKKKVDLMVANRAADALEGDDTHALLVSVQDCADPGPMSKRALADQILDWLSLRLQKLEWAEASE